MFAIFNLEHVLSKKQTEAGQYYVYGGGGATFTTKSYNRESAITVSRFALSKECTRF